MSNIGTLVAIIGLALAIAAATTIIVVSRVRKARRDASVVRSLNTSPHCLVDANGFRQEPDRWVV